MKVMSGPNSIFESSFSKGYSPKKRYNFNLPSHVDDTQPKEKKDDYSNLSLNELFENMNIHETIEKTANEEGKHPGKSHGHKKRVSFDNVDMDYIEASQNVQGNYHNYVYKCLKSIAPLKRLSFSDAIEEKMLYLPETKQKTLILDLDETLIHADFDNRLVGHDHLITFKYEDYEVSVPIFIRPGLFEFLEAVSETYEVFVFTASKKEYADAVLNFLDPENRFFKQRFYRENCISIKNRVYIKDLRIFLNRKQENIIMVDNSLYSTTNQISNGVLINSFYNDKEDKELLNLLNYLQNFLLNVPDVRSMNEKIFNFSSILDEFAQNEIKALY